MKILLWNCRDGHNPNLLRNLHTLVEWNNSTVLALTETRMDHILNSLDCTDVLQVPATGYLGGTALFWRSSEITID